MAVSVAAAVLVGPSLAAVTVHVPAGHQLRGVRAWCGGEVGLARVVLASLAAVVVSAAVGWRFAGSPVLLAFMWMGWTGVVLAFIDLDCRRLPDRLVAVMSAEALFFLVLLLRWGLAPLGSLGGRCSVRLLFSWPACCWLWLRLGQSGVAMRPWLRRLRCIWDGWGGVRSPSV